MSLPPYPSLSCSDCAILLANALSHGPLPAMGIALPSPLLTCGRCIANKANESKASAPSCMTSPPASTAPSQESRSPTAKGCTSSEVAIFDLFEQTAQNAVSKGSSAEQLALSWCNYPPLDSQALYEGSAPQDSSRAERSPVQKFKRPPKRQAGASSWVAAAPGACSLVAAAPGACDEQQRVPKMARQPSVIEARAV